MKQGGNRSVRIKGRAAVFYCQISAMCAQKFSEPLIQMAQHLMCTWYKVECKVGFVLCIHAKVA